MMSQFVDFASKLLFGISLPGFTTLCSWSVLVLLPLELCDEPLSLIPFFFSKVIKIIINQSPVSQALAQLQ